MPKRAARPDQICLGLSAIDQTWFVDPVPGEPTKTLANDFATDGGMAATAAATIARLGSSDAFSGRGGDDAAGRDSDR